MSIVNWFETDVKIPPGGIYEHNCSGGTNVVQIINRRAAGGGNVFADTRASLKQDYYLIRVDQGKNGVIAHPKQIDKIYLTSDSASDVYVSVLEIFATNLDMVYNASQIVQMTGAVTVNSMPNVTIGSMPEVEIKNDSGNPITVATHAVTASGTFPVTDNGGSLTVDGSVNIGTMPTVTANIGTMPTVTVNTHAVTASGTFPVTDNAGSLTIDSTQLPAALTAAGNIKVAMQEIITVQTQANAWSAAAVLAAGNSAAIDVLNSTSVCAFGNVSAATDIKVFVSVNNTNFYDTGIKQTLAAAGDFYIQLNNMGARYVRLQSSAAATITANIAGKVG